MSLVVVDPGEQVTGGLRTQLVRLGYDYLPAADLTLALEMCKHAPPELIVCADPEWARELAQRFRRVPVVLAEPTPPAADRVLWALRSGLRDVWQLPQEESFVRERIDDILRASAAAETQAEQRLSQYVADLQRDQRAGRYIQMGMLPPSPMAIERYRFQHRIVPSLILTGDFVDYFRITDRHFAFYVADVSGHGASSAFVTVLLKNFSRRLRREYRPSMLTEPGQILEWFNRELLEQKMDKHVAMIMAVGDLEANSVSMVNAGHFPPAILITESDPRFVEQKGKPVGLFENVSYEATRVQLGAGDRLVFFSDGVLDSFDGLDLPQKERRLLDAAGAENGMDAIWAALGVGPQVEVPDDMTCLTIRREG